uniref:phosphoinositide 5-phosphatase n=3 Tax=Lygus hesperus TaxID=30085 RepID=A0A0A9XCU3_LYGHE
MSSVDITNLAQWKVNPGDTVISCVNASLMQGWVRTTRYLAIVSNGCSTALFVLTSSNIPPTSVQQINIERIVPFDLNFKCDLESEAKDVGPDLFLAVTHQKLILLFELDLGDKSNMFVAELYKATEKVNRGNGFLEFSWLQKYNPTYRIEQTDEEVEQQDDIDSPDISINRESLAKGASLLAAREAVIKYHMSKKESEYTYTQTFRIFVGTWNVNNQLPTVSLQDWLACDIEPPDIYAVGFQELDLSTAAYVVSDSPREDEWRFQVEKGLHQGAEYQRVALIRLIGMLLLVYVQTKHINHVKKVYVDSVGTGILSKMGNKGGVSVRMEIHNTSICFVNSHLAAHVVECERRNQDYKDICRRTSFSGFSPPLAIRDHDHIYWLGDLNYRITPGMDVEVVKDYLARKNFKPILEYDQLNYQRRKENVFKDFKEGAIDFMPTYKYDVGTDNWDSSGKERAPAWCDRILWKGDSIRQLEYRSHQVYRISDHKPVSAVFLADIKKVDNVKWRKIHEEVMKKLDKLENEFLPQVTVDTTEIKYNPINFLESQTRSLTIANNGQVPVKFEFIKKLEDVSYCKDWLTIDPYTSDVHPGETCTIRLEVLVDKKSAFKLNSGYDQLYDILVLHLVGGKDIFITVTGEYERSCFGTSLETLAHIPGPIKEVPPGRLLELERQLRESSQGLDAVGSYPVPKEVWFLVDHLHRHGMKTNQLFIQSGLTSEIEAIRTWLDCWSLAPMPGSVYSVAEALVLLLESTAEPIIPYECYSKSLEVAHTYQLCKKIVQELPFHKKNVFIYLCLFLRELVSHSEDNKLDVNTLATLFGGIFLRDPPWHKKASAGKYWVTNQQNTNIRRKATFVSHFLTTDDPTLGQIVSTSGQ